jgi:hypothetical protein
MLAITILFSPPKYCIQNEMCMFMDIALQQGSPEELRAMVKDKNSE